MLFECPIITGTVAICFTFNKLIIFSLGGNRNSRLQEDKEEDNSKFQPMDLSWRSYQNDRTLKLTDQGSELFALLIPLAMFEPTSRKLLHVFGLVQSHLCSKACGPYLLT